MSVIAIADWSCDFTASAFQTIHW